MVSPGPLHVLMNAAAGSGGDAKKLAEQLEAAGLSAVVEPVDADNLRRRIRELGPIDRLGIAGGDGSQRTAAELLRGTATVLIPFPTGTLNHFARRMGIADTAQAIAAAAGGGSQPTSVGVLNGEREYTFLNTAVVGAYPDVIRLRERMRPVMGKWPAAFVAGLVMWARWPCFDLTIKAGDQVLHRHTPMIWIGTGPGTFPAPHEAPLPGRGDGLELVLLPPGGRRHGVRLFRSLWARRRGRGPETVGLEVLRAGEVEIDAGRHHVHLTLDAEPIVTRSRVRITLEDGALQVALAPEAAE
jgi:diacylglycerol kinase family enzyme